MLNGIVFDEQLVTSRDAAHAYWKFNGEQNGVINGCAVTTASNNLYVAAGYMMAYGRLTKVTGTETISAPTASGTLYCRLVYEIDLSQTNTEQAFNQGIIKVVSDSSAYPALTQQNLDESGTVYQMPLAKFICTSGVVSDLADDRQMCKVNGQYITMNSTAYGIVKTTVDTGVSGYITFVTEA